MADVIYEIESSPARRWLGIGSYGFVGIAVPLALTTGQASWIWFGLLLGFAAIMVWQAVRLYGTTGRKIILTEDALTMEDGTLIAPISEIESVDRGVFALKPSNGFGLLLKSKAPKGSVAGMWWRRGRRIGVGGLISGHATRGMADMISALVIQRNGEIDLD